MTTKLATLTSNDKAYSARADIERMLKRIGCDAIHFIDDIEKCELRLLFQHKGTRVMLPVSARTWTSLFLRLRPWRPDNRMSEQHYRDNAARQGLMAISPMLKTWLFGQVIAVENGLVPFERAFLPNIQVNNDQTIADVATKLIPRPETGISK